MPDDNYFRLASFYVLRSEISTSGQYICLKTNDDSLYIISVVNSSNIRINNGILTRLLTIMSKKERFVILVPHDVPITLTLIGSRLIYLLSCTSLDVIGESWATSAHFLILEQDVTRSISVAS